MKNHYGNDVYYAKGYYTNSRTYYLGDLWVAPTLRRLGYATRLMTQLCKDADQEGVDIQLDCIPAVHGMDFYELMKFYERFGFEFIALCTMRRTPNEKDKSLVST